MRRLVRSAIAAAKEATKIRRPEAIPAFTLVELIVVITILAVLATVGFLSLSGYSDDARSAVTKANVRMVYSAIATESATTGNSPRYYVEHDPAAGLSGAITVGNTTVALSGGKWDQPGTNYSSGNPKWDLLKLNPEKFRLAVGGASALPDAFAAYDSGAVTVGAVDVTSGTSLTGKKLSKSVFQVAAVSPSTKTVSTMGNYSTGSTVDLAGLVKNPSSTSVTGALVETVSLASSPAPPPVNGTCGSANGVASNSTPSANLCASGSGSAVTGSGPWNWSCTGTNGGTTAACSAPLASYSVSGSFGANGAGATVSVCGGNVTADSSGNFVRSSIPAGTVCNNVTATRAGYSCTTSVNGPAILSSNATNVAGSCTSSAVTVSGWTYVGTSLFGSSTDYSARVGYSYSISDPVACSTLCGSSPKALCYSSNDQFCQCYNTWNTRSDRSGSAVSCYTNDAYPKYSISGSFGTNAAGATVSACGYSTTADSNGNFSISNVASGTACNNVYVVQTGGYANCSISVNGPASISSNVTNVSGSCSPFPTTCSYDVVKLLGYGPNRTITINNACGPIILNIVTYDPGNTTIVNNSGKSIDRINYITYNTNTVTYNVAPTNGVTQINAISSSNWTTLQACPNAGNWWSPWTTGTCDNVFDNFFSSYSSSQKGYRNWYSAYGSITVQ